MGTTTHLEVRGAARLARTLIAAGADLDDLKDVHAQVAGIVKVAALGNVKRVSGTLAGTIRSTGQKSAAVVRAGYARRGVYAGVDNWGNPHNGRRATNFLTDAAKSTEPIWIGVYFGGLERILDKIEGI